MIKNQKLSEPLDFVGFSASLLCAIHCGALPILLAFVPMAGVRFLTDPWVEYVMIVTSLIIASLSLIHGYRKHHQQASGLWVAGVGFALIFAGHGLAYEGAEIVFTTLGATLIAVAHLINLKLVRQA